MWGRDSPSRRTWDPRTTYTWRRRSSTDPYVGVGAGIRNLSFPTGSGIEDVDDVVLVISAGGQIRLGERSHLRIDLRDLISSFDVAAFEESRRQHDVLLSVGVGVGI